MDVFKYRKLLIDIVKDGCDPKAKVVCTPPTVNCRTHRVDGRVMFTYETHGNVYIKGKVNDLAYLRIYDQWHERVLRMLGGGRIETNFNMEIESVEGLPDPDKEGMLEKDSSYGRPKLVAVVVESPYTLVRFRITAAHDRTPPAPVAANDTTVAESEPIIGRLGNMLEDIERPRLEATGQPMADADVLVRTLQNLPEMAGAGGVNYGLARAEGDYRNSAAVIAAGEGARVAGATAGRAGRSLRRRGRRNG